MRTLKRVRNIILNVLIFAICIAVAFLASKYMFTTIEVIGTSMETTVHNGDTVLIYKPLQNYRYGDIVVFDSHQVNSNGDERYLIKRIIGMPGDTVEIIQNPDDGKYYVWRNGEKLEEDYVLEENAMTAEMARVTVPEGKFLYMGDNRKDSYDSRASGTLRDFSDIVGLVIMRYVDPDDGIMNDLSIVKRLSK